MGLRPLWRVEVESVFQADRFDLLDWRRGCEAVPRAKQADQEAQDELCGHPVQDGFFGLYKAAPRLKEPAPSGLQPLADLFRRGMETPEWARLRDSCRGDEVASAIGAIAFFEEVIKSLPEEVRRAAKEVAERAREAGEAEAQEAALQELLSLILERKGEAERKGDEAEALHLAEEAQAISEVLQNLQERLEVAQKEAKEALSAYEALAEEKSAQIANALNKASGEARKEAQEASVFVRGFSLAAGGDATYVSPEVARAAFEALRRNPNLKRLAEMLGWARRVVRAEWRKSPRARTEMTGYKIHHLRPEEMAPVEWTYLASRVPALIADWQRRASDGSIRHRRFEGLEKKGRGPLVIVRDESDSMRGAPHSLAVALEWALLEVSRADNRRFISIPFSGSGEFHVWEAPPPGRPDPEGLLSHLSHFYGHGTEPYAPLEKALELIEAGDLRADVLIITDARFGTPPEGFLSSLKVARGRRPLRVVAVVVGVDISKAKKFADRVIRVDDLVKNRELLRSAIREVV
jgi:uncharacterized protein with von Willebrand factor type A (vWA) domain